MYADYDFYLNEYYGDSIPAEEFQKLSARASDYVRAATQGISDTVDGLELEAVKKASCAVAEVLLDEGIMNANTYSGEAQVSSETVGPWSRSYRNQTLSTADIEYLDKRKRDALLMYLGALPAFAPVFKVRSYPCLHRTT